ncbi:MAG: outer membrane protein assembly factor BamB [Cardiobacteriaceae bacterium]|nr:outer membrane protein assembly factor BamB [Cardiobacteriaceae bacterium]
MNATLRHILLGSALLALTACSTTDFFLGEDNRPAAKALPATANSVQTSVLWTQRLGKENSAGGLALQPDSDGERIFAVSADGRLSAFDADSGATLYQVRLGNRISAGVAAAPGYLYVGTHNGDLLALNAEDGTPAWRQALGGQMISRPASDGQIVVARTQDGRISAFRADSGQLLWRYHINEPAFTMRGNASPVIGGGVVIVTSDSGYFVVLQQENGLPVVEQRLAIGRGSGRVSRMVDMDATPMVNRGLLFGAAYQSMMFAVDLERGAPAWQQEAVSTPRDFALSQDGLFLSTDIDHIAALNQQDGSIRWQSAALEGRGLSPVFAIPGRIGVLDREGYLHWLDDQRGTLLGQTRIGRAAASAPPLVLRDKIVWQLDDGRLVAFRPQ